MIMKNEQRIKDLEEDLIELINKEIKTNTGILGISISSHGGSHLASKFKKALNLNETEMSAASSSLVFLSSKILQDSLNQQISYNLITGKENIILSILTESIAMISYLNRELAELDGLDSYITELKKFAIQVSAIVETSDLIKEEVFVAIKRAIPNALIIAIITKDGLPIKIQSTMPEPMLSAMTSAIYNLAGILLGEGLEFSIIGGENGSIIIHELDKNRILAIAVPEADERKLGTYIVKIKSVLS
jgi:predicted regulator of Ras-like GTPase activity (Roadblock/LC7/MglB family)